MARILTCIDGGSDLTGICPVGQSLEIVEGYILLEDPSVINPLIAGQYFSLSFGIVLTVYILARSSGAVINMFRG